MSAAPPPAVPEWTLADRLRKARELAGYSQAELAAATGISRQSVNSYETGRTAPRRPQLLAWATACHVEYEWLTGGGSPHGRGPLKLPASVRRDLAGFTRAQPVKRPA
jgi:transcriptional regulator with XRE-family HTH domain